MLGHHSEMVIDEVLGDFAIWLRLLLLEPCEFGLVADPGILQVFLKGKQIGKADREAFPCRGHADLVVSQNLHPMKRLGRIAAIGRQDVSLCRE